MTDAEDLRWMDAALREAEKAYDLGEVPIGCVIVKDGRCIARGYNQVETLKDATAHAEIIAVRLLRLWKIGGFPGRLFM